MLWTIFVVLLILWLLGFSLHVGRGDILLLAMVVSCCSLLVQRMLQTSC